MSGEAANSTAQAKLKEAKTALAKTTEKRKINIREIQRLIAEKNRRSTNLDSLGQSIEDQSHHGHAKSTNEDLEKDKENCEECEAELARIKIQLQSAQNDVADNISIAEGLQAAAESADQEAQRLREELSMLRKAYNEKAAESERFEMRDLTNYNLQQKQRQKEAIETGLPALITAIGEARVISRSAA